MIPTDNTEFAPHVDGSVSAQQLCQQFRRDLLWALTSADRWSSTHTPETLAPPDWVHTWLNALTDQALLSSDLHYWQQRRLGHYFEALWRFYLQQHPEWQLLLANHVVYDTELGQKRTRGEIDFVLQHRNTHYVLHIEVAVKFYLAVPQAMNTHWLGPSLQDCLARKLHHLAHRQLPLGHHDAVVAQLGRPPDASMAIIKGRGFWPYSSDESGKPTNHITAHDGYWISVSNAATMLADGQFAVLSRREWLAGPQAPAWRTWRATDTATLTERAPVQLVLRPTSTDTKHVPTSLFVVPDDWLSRAHETIAQARLEGSPI